MTPCSGSELRRIRKEKEVTSVKINIWDVMSGRPVARKWSTFLPLAFRYLIF
jgi:hypothetical protein